MISFWVVFRIDCISGWKSDLAFNFVYVFVYSGDTVGKLRGNFGVIESSLEVKRRTERKV